MTAEPISWSTAERVAAKVARTDPFATSYLRQSLDSELLRLTRIAEPLVEAETGLVADGPAKVVVVERDVWATANIESFQRVFDPLAEKLASQVPSGPAAQIGRAITGTQLGVILGWMSTRVLGQYIPVIHEEQRDRQDLLFYVAPNMLAMEKKFAFPPEEFRLWIAVHECTHRAQFTGVPWMPAYFRSLIDKLLSNVDADPQALRTVIENAARSIRESKSSKSSGDLVTLLASPEQRETIRRLQGLMALLEGHAEVVMSRAAAEHIPSAERFHRVIETRRKKASPVAKVFQRLLGLDAKMRQYAEGATFVRALEAEGGAGLVAQLWRSSEDLPVYEEILDPSLWIKRHAPVAP